MENNIWSKEVQNNFNNAATTYSKNSKIQKYFAKKIVFFLKDLNTPLGKWIDLGSGTGLLADEIENNFPGKNVYRVDFSEKMLNENRMQSKKFLWDLNNGLPPSIENCSLIASNFCLHWLNYPEQAIKNWFKKLNSGGFLIISSPTNESFPEWKETCKKNNIEYSGLTFPDSKKILSLFKSDEIYLANNYSYIENFSNVYKLFRNIINVGSNSTKSNRKSVGELKKMQKYWPKNQNNSVNLSWKINIQIFKKL